MTLVEMDAPAPCHPPKVLLVDDDPAVLASLRRMLRREPYEVLSTIRPYLALSWIEHNDVDLVVVDQRMPDLCGTEFARRVRRSSPGTIRVLLTAYAGATLVQHGLADDVQWLISKPWNDDALRLTLRQLLQGQQTGPRPDRERASWMPGNVVGRVLKFAARGVGWGLGFLGTTDVGGGL